MDALFVVDVDGYDEWPSKIEDLGTSAADKEIKEVAFSIVATLKTWRRDGGTIIFGMLLESAVAMEMKVFQLTGEGPSDCIACKFPKKSRLAEFLEHGHGENYEPVFVKTECDPFTNRHLFDFLQTKEITRIFLAGCSTSVCLLAAAKGAVSRGIHVVLLEKCSHPILEGEEEERQWIDEVRSEISDPSIKVEVWKRPEE